MVCAVASERRVVAWQSLSLQTLLRLLPVRHPNLHDQLVLRRGLAHYQPIPWSRLNRRHATCFILTARKKVGNWAQILGLMKSETCCLRHSCSASALLAALARRQRFGLERLLISPNWTLRTP